MIPYRRHLRHHARELRRGMTDAERKLWTRLRRKRLGHRVTRQKPIGRYIADFYCHAAKLVIEVDGGQHFEEQLRHDRIRDRWLRHQGILVLRFHNLQVLKHAEVVAEEIARVVNERTRGRE